MSLPSSFSDAGSHTTVPLESHNLAARSIAFPLWLAGLGLPRLVPACLSVVLVLLLASAWGGLALVFPLVEITHPRSCLRGMAFWMDFRVGLSSNGLCARWCHVG